MKNNAKQKSKTSENVRIYVNFTKKEKEALKEYTLWQYERWEKTKEASGGNVRDLVLIGFLGFNAAFPIFAQLTITYKEVNGEKIEVEKLQGLESTLEEMAKFLCVDRSAMSRELCKMRDEGILRFNKNHFELIK